MTIATTTLGDGGLPVSRLGVGLAAVARPGYITLGRAHDLPERSPHALYQRCADILDAARAARVRYVDVARSFAGVQATFNIREPSVRDGLAAARVAGLGVILKEVHANGRLTPANEWPQDRRLRARLDDIARHCGLAVDQLAMAFAAAQPWS